MKSYDDLIFVFAPRLRQAIKQSGLSVKQVAASIYSDYTTVSYYLQGRRMPGAQNLYLLSDTLGVSIDWLFGRDGQGMEERE